MELNEKLKLLREEKGITQEELAEDLFVSRTAISKWESGRGCPSIDSLKAIAKYFGVTIDELISSDAIITIAENDTKAKIEGIKNFFIGIVDMMTILLIVLPLYPHPVEGFIYSVNLFEYSEATAFNRTMYFVLFISLMLIGIIMTVNTLIGKNRIQSILTKVSIIVSVITILFTILARDPYPAVLAFILLMIKLVIIWYRIGTAKA